MQANTVGDEYTWNLTESDGATQFPMSGVTSAQVAIAGPFTTAAAALAAGAASGILFPATLNATLSQAAWVTIVAGDNGQTKTTYPTGGYYVHQVVLNYSNGSIAKSRLFVIQISDSIS